MIAKLTGLSLIFLSLTACQTLKFPSQTLKIQDGPPKAISHKHQKGSKTVVSKVVPKAEPRSRYGNPDSYQVLGKTYHVLSSSKAFSQQGLASWYGTKFHSKRTSSGEPYNMHAMTAAHKTLPLPTYIKVKNTDSGRELIVKVNDRGPFHEGRIIDLSYAAAKALGVVKHGVARVLIKSIALDNAVDPMFYLQIAAFKKQQSAEHFKALVDKFLEKKEVHVEAKGMRFVVTVGPFKTKLTRNKIKQQLLAHGIKGTFAFMR